MAKRFADTELYDKDWFVALTPNQKLLWHYATSKCNSAGIWDINKITACRMIGINDIDLSEFVEACNADGKERVFLFANNRKLFITTTILFQCGSILNPKIFAHKGIVDKIYSHKETAEWFESEISRGTFTVLNSSHYPNTTLTLPQRYPNVTLKEKEKDIYINNNIDNNYSNNKIIKEESIIIKEDEKQKTWRDDFQTYLSELNLIYDNLILDSDFIKQQEEFHPNLDIVLSLKKAYTNYWGTVAGWKYKKRQKSKTIDWKATLTNAIDLNKVYKPREVVKTRKGTSLSDMQDIQDSFNKNLLSNGSY